jgi:hypothetical protein
MAKQNKQHAANDDRAKKTLYVTGFKSKRVTKKLLKELFTQGGPVADIAMFDDHAFVRFQHAESVPYCLALFNEVELFGDKLRLNPKYKSRDTFSYMRYLTQVREKLRDEYMNKEPPDLPAKRYTESSKTKSKKQANKKRNKLDKFEEQRSKTKHSIEKKRRKDCRRNHQPLKK